jgi:type I restriction-modification system DNA methylase subunit
MTIPDKILQLVERFDANLPDYKHSRYNETQTRQEFINPFFKALGWDMDNAQGLPEASKEVIHEANVNVGKATKSPDYCFRVGNIRKFFVEAKKPSVYVKEDIHPAYQLRRYGWSAKLPLSILTDFEEFAVYDCRIKPGKADKAAHARLMYLTYTDYAAQWETIAATFSRDAVLSGSFDQYAETHKDKRGTLEVDVAFLQEIERWRDLLARNFALRNPALTRRELNFAVQRTIDRIIFLRICEDRGIEEYGRLMALQNGEQVYTRLLQLFYQADDRYNSGIFHFKTEREHPEPHDALTPNLQLDDPVLKDIFKNLYYPDSPYEFSVLPADILGQVYEQFLGKVIRLTAGHQAKVEEKPEVKKAGGVYYTPTYIVEYIVRQTVGELLKTSPPVRPELVEGRVHGSTGSPRTGLTGDKTLKQAENLTILDPACGSGSFLIGAYQYLLDWYRDQYLRDPQKWIKGRQPRLYQVSQQDWKLTIDERKRILLSHIYGVDIDSQAVEVTKLSLLLKVLEGEDEQTISSQMALFQQRVLPDLSNNIKCGNSLIGSDFYIGKQLAFDEEELYRVNAFDWDREFSEIVQKGGFDVVIGNPPYVLLQGEFCDNEQLSYFRNKFYVASYKIDTYHLFMEQAIKLAQSGGLCSMITPANFITNNYLTSLRRFILENSAIEKILVIDEGVFQGISVDNAIFIVTSGQLSETFRIVHVYPESGDLKEKSEITISTKGTLHNEHVLFTGSSEGPSNDLWEKISRKSIKLGEITDVNFGKQLRDRKKFINDVISIQSLSHLQPPYKPCYTGRDISKYYIKWNNIVCFDDAIARRGGCWDADKHNAKNKLITRQIGEHPEFALDRLGYQCLNTIFMINLRTTDFDPCFILGVLNSKVIKAIWLNKFYDQRRTFPKIKGTYLKLLPIYQIDFSNPTDKARHDQMVKLVERMLDLHKQLAEAKIPQAQTMLKRQIEATDRQIDRLVYELYGLTEEEIRIIEEGP